MNKANITITVDADIKALLSIECKGKASTIINDFLREYFNTKNNNKIEELIKKKSEIEKQKIELLSKESIILKEIDKYNIENEKQNKEKFDNLRIEYFDLDQKTKDKIIKLSHNSGISPVQYYIENVKDFKN